MIIGVVSDTHMPSRGDKLPDRLVKGLRGVDLILHAGDWTQLIVKEMLEAIAPVEGIAGNNDGMEIVSALGRQKLLTLEGRKIGLIHGDGPAGSAERQARHSFRGGEADIVIFGHSHIPFLEQDGGRLLFNPGSPTDKRWQPRYSYGLLTLGRTVKAKHVYYDDKS
jgi:putative phosphoesterase